MKHISILLFAAITALLTGCNQVPQTDPDPRVWNNPPAVSYSHTSHNGGWDFTILKVHLGDTATTVQMRVSGYSGQFYTFAQGTTLKADGKSYKLLSIDGLIPGQYKPLSKSRHDDLTFHFEPMPATTTSFDLLESETNPGAFNVYGIHKYNPDSKAIINTHWRNLRTGDWVISFLDSCVIYDCKVWNYRTRPNSETAAVQTIVVEQDDQVASIMISPLKHGKRTLRVQAPDGTKQFSCSAFDSRNLPDYPKIGRRAYKLVDFGYEKVDTVTVSGFLIGPGRNNMSYTIDVIDPLIADNPKFAFKTDKNGCFSVKFPLANTSFGVVRGGRSGGLSMPVEPGQSYFVYDNSVSGQQFVMGKNSRVQNDYFTYSQDFHAHYERMEETQYKDPEDYLQYLIGTRDTFLMGLEQLRVDHPGLTDAFMDLAKAYASVELYRQVGQARFQNTDPNNMYAIQPCMMEFLQKDLKTHSIKPYSLYYEFNYFLRDLNDHLSKATAASMTISLGQIINMLVKERDDLSADDKAELEWFGQINDQLSKLVQEFMNDNDKLTDTLSKVMEPHAARYEKASNKLKEFNLDDMASRVSDNILANRMFDNILLALDTLEFEQSFNDFVLTQYMANRISSSRKSAPAILMARYDSIVTAKACRDAIHRLNDKYLELENADLASLGNDVSPEELAGPNCVHYNLPADQQTLVEQYLKVSGYPTYRLLNRNGALLDVSCHPGNLPALIETLKKL